MPETRGNSQDWNEEEAPREEEFQQETSKAKSGNLEPPGKETIDTTLEAVLATAKRADEASARAEKNAATSEIKVDLIYKLAIAGIFGVTITLLGFLLTFGSFLYDVMKDSEKYNSLKEENLTTKDSLLNIEKKQGITSSVVEEFTGENSLEEKFKRLNDRLTNLEQNSK